VMAHPEMGLGSAARPLGLLARALGLREEAMAHFERALAMNSAMNARPWTARTRQVYGSMLIADGDADRGEALVREAHDEFAALGMECR
jgi:tetratricopeptide (TPR) repeat protein